MAPPPAQQILPFIEWKANPNHAEWLRIANAGPEHHRFLFGSWRTLFCATWKRYHFYAFKSRWLERHAVPDGYDVQVLRLDCHGCGGSGTWHSHYSERRDRCNRCYGSGVYRWDAVKLTRWIVAGHVFHIPDVKIRDVDVWPDDPPESYQSLKAGARNEFQGKIVHAGVTYSQGIRAFLKLLWVYDRNLFYRIAEILIVEAVEERWQRWTQPIRSWFLRAHYWLCNDESRMARDLREMFGFDHETDDIPF
jgi:hypothetical protein